MWTYLLKSKDEAVTAFKNFYAMVSNKPDRRVKVSRSDRGGELCSNEFKAYCKENGIRHLTSPYTSPLKLHYREAEKNSS